MNWLERCLDNLISGSGEPHIIVIDNNSKDDTVNFIKKNYPVVQLIEAKKNLGFGQGNNVGLIIAVNSQADYIFLINQDAYVETDTLEKLINAHKNNSEFGILSPIHLNGTGDEFDDHFYKFLLQSDITEIISSEILNTKKSTNIINTSFVNAAAWLISRECLIKTGGFDPIFFHYGEDDNYAQRALFKGFKIGILTTTKIFHDKERSYMQEPTDYQNLKGDKIIFLNQACDLHNPAYKILMAKRFLRYFLLTIISVASFNKKGWQYNYGMARHISKSFNKVRASRSISKHAKTPYLDVENRSFQNFLTEHLPPE